MTDAIAMCRGNHRTATMPRCAGFPFLPVSFWRSQMHGACRGADTREAPGYAVLQFRCTDLRVLAGRSVRPNAPESVPKRHADYPRTRSGYSVAVVVAGHP